MAGGSYKKSRDSRLMIIWVCNLTEEDVILPEGTEIQIHMGRRSSMRMQSDLGRVVKGDSLAEQAENCFNMEMNALSSEGNLIKQRREQLVSQAKQNLLCPEEAETLATVESKNTGNLNFKNDCDFMFSEYPREDEDVPDHIHSMDRLNSDKTSREPEDTVGLPPTMHPGNIDDPMDTSTPLTEEELQEWLIKELRLQDNEELMKQPSLLKEVKRLVWKHRNVFLSPNSKLVGKTSLVEMEIEVPAGTRPISSTS